MGKVAAAVKKSVLAIMIAGLMVCAIVPVKAYSAVTMLGWFVIGRVFNYVSSSPLDSPPTQEEVELLASSAMAHLPMEIEGGIALISARPAAPRTVEYVFQWLDLSANEIPVEAVDLKWGLPLFEAVCSQEGYLRWLSRGGMFVFTFKAKDGKTVKTYWADPRDCQN